MTRNITELRLIANSPAPLTKLTDTSGNPRESYYWRHMATVRRERQHEFWRPYLNALALPLSEMRSVELRVREELYPQRLTGQRMAWPLDGEREVA